MKYKIAVGNYYKDIEGNKVCNGLMGFEVEVDNIEKIKQALQLLNIEAWEICEKGLGGKVLERSQLLIDQEARLNKARDEHNAKMIQLNEEITNLPSILQTWQFGDFTIELKRSPAEYDPNYSSKLRVSLTFQLSRANKPIRDHFFPTDYITSDGKVQSKKFLTDFGHIINDRDLALTKAGEEIAKAMLEKLKEMKETREKFKSKYQLW